MCISEIPTKNQSEETEGAEWGYNASLGDWSKIIWHTVARLFFIFFIFFINPLHHFLIQKRAPSGTPTWTSLPWKQLREWGRSMFRPGRTDWLSWRAGGKGHQTDSGTPNWMTLQNSFDCRFSPTLWKSWHTQMWWIIIPVILYLITHPQLWHCNEIPTVHSTNGKALGAFLCSFYFVLSVFLLLAFKLAFSCVCLDTFYHRNVT